MAKGKGKPSAPAASRQRKNHGPKRHLFKEFKPMIKVIADTGLLSKYYNKESFELSLAARGIKKDTNARWAEFKLLPTIAAKKEWFKNLKK